MADREPRACDVLVIGAGPAGSAAARFAAQRGVSVILLERRERVGLPVRCAEYVPLTVDRYVSLSHPGLMVQSVRTMATHIAGEPVKRTNAPGAVINRDVLDQTLADLAVQAGACLRKGWQARSRSGGRVVAQGHGREVSIACRVIIGADGPCSLVSRWMGNNRPDLLPSIQYRVSLAKALDGTQVYFRPYLRGGYGWLFPKGSQANLGIALSPQAALNLRQTLECFRRELLEEGLIKEDLLGQGGGLVPVGGLGRVAGDNLILAGDGAGTCHPITGAGVGNALISGELAGRAAAEAVRRNSLGPLHDYERDLGAHLGHSLALGVRKRKSMLEQWPGPDFSKTIRAHWVAFKEYYKNV